jgi:hypothetical protein
MPSLDPTSPNTFETLNQAPKGNAKNVRILWQKGALIAEQNNDFFMQFEGRSENSPIWTKTELSKGNGSTMVFTTQSGFYKEPKLGGELFLGPDDYEEIVQDAFELKVDFARFGCRTDERMEEMMGMRGDLESGVNKQLGKALGRFKTEQVMALYVLRLTADHPENCFFAGGKTLNTLRSQDIFRWDEVVNVTQGMMPLGGLPANIRGHHVGGEPIWSMNYIAPTPALTSLKLDSAYRTVLANAMERGKSNTLFKGGFPLLDGNTILPYNPIDHDGIGPMGSFMNPKAYLGNAAIAGGANGGNTVIDIYGGGNATDHLKARFFRHFLGSPYKFIDTGAFANDTASEKYFIVYNLSGANTNKWCMYAYVAGNDGTKITITKRLASTTSGAAGQQTIGSVTWDANLNHGDHPLGSLVIPVNAKGVPYGRVIVMGASGLLRGYGKYRAEHRSDTENGGFIQNRYMATVFGQCFKKDRKKRAVGAAMLTCAISYPNVVLPNYT